MKKNTILENVKIEKIVFGGVWIATLKDGKKIIISWWALPDMIADLRVLRNKKDYIKAQIFKIRSFGKNLYENICAHHMFFDDEKNFTNWCGGCKRQVLPYEDQVKVKEDVIKDCFANSDFFEKVYSGFVPSEKIFNYRNKMEFSFGKYFVKNESVSERSVWFHKQGMFSKIVDVQDCMIAWEKINSIFLYIKNILQQTNLEVYDQFKHTWFFRHLIIREWVNTNQILVNLSIASKYFLENPQKLEEWEKLQEKLKNDKFILENIKSFVITENNWLWDSVNGPSIKTFNLLGNWNIQEKLFINWKEIEFRISAFAFFQTNTHQAQKLFETAINMLPKINWNVLDLYCGAWTIGLSLLKSGIWEKLLGVEIVESAIEDAKHNAKVNKLESKSKFIADKAENLNFELENIWLVVLDPPRSGLHKDLINFLWNLKKDNKFKLLYISCNPTTLNRDLKLLQEQNFEIKNLKAVDMFPHTHHIEMISLLY